MTTLEDAAIVDQPQGNKKPSTRQLHRAPQARVLAGVVLTGFAEGAQSPYKRKLKRLN